MKITAVIERASDGTFACCAEKKVGKILAIGYGESAEEAKADMIIAFNEMKEIQEEAGVVVPQVEFSYRYDMPSFFSAFPYFNISRLAELAGINASQMRQFNSGAAKASERHYQKLKQAVEKVKLELSAVVL